MCAFDMPGEFEYLADVTELFRSHGAEVHVVELCADFEVRLERNKTENRLAHKESKRDLAWSEGEMRQTSAKYRLNSFDGEVLPFESYLKLDNTTLQPEEAAAIIKAHFGLQDP